MPSWQPSAELARSGGSTQGDALDTGKVRGYDPPHTYLGEEDSAQMWTTVSAAQIFVYMQTLKWDTETEKTGGTVTDLRPHRFLLCKVLRKTEPMTTREKNHLDRTGMCEPQDSEGSYKMARAERTRCDESATVPASHW